MSESEKAKFVYHFGAATNPTCPYKGKINKLRHGDLILFRGSVHSSGSRFQVNLVANKSDFALHIAPRFDENIIVRNSKEHGRWKSEERTKGCNPFSPGKRFEISILVLEDRFKIAFYKRHIDDFKYRLPVASINAVDVSGDITLDSIHTQPGYETWKLMPQITLIPPSPLFPVEKDEIDGKSEPLNELPIEKLPVCYGFLLKVPFYGQIPGGLTAGRTIFATILPRKGYTRWTISLRTSHASIRNLAFSFGVRHDENKIVLNSTDEKGMWQKELYAPHNPVKRGRHTDVVIVCEESKFTVSVHNLHLAEFNHRYTKLQDIRVMSVEGGCRLIHLRVQ